MFSCVSSVLVLSSLLHPSAHLLRPRVEAPICAVASAPSSSSSSDGAAKSSPRRKNKSAKLPQIAVIGRPNVGKSTIANRLTKAFDRGGLVFNEPGWRCADTHARTELHAWSWMHAWGGVGGWGLPAERTCRPVACGTGLFLGISKPAGYSRT